MLPTCQTETEQALHLISRLSSLRGQNVQHNFWNKSWWAAAAPSRRIVKTSIELLRFLQALSVSSLALYCISACHSRCRSVPVETSIHSLHCWKTPPVLRHLSSVSWPLIELDNYVFTVYTIKMQTKPPSPPSLISRKLSIYSHLFICRHNQSQLKFHTN